MSATRTAAACLAAIAIILAAPATRGNVPPGITNFQGVLRDAQNHPLDGPYAMRFDYWSDPTSALDASHIGSESHAVVTVTGGLLDVQLGSQAFAPGRSGYGGGSIGTMFGDFDQVWLEITVGNETLAPRIRFAASAYAFNCSQLQDRSPDEFLRSEGSDNFTGSALYGYTMTFDPATTLNVAGTFQLGGVSVASSAAELNKLAGTGAGVTPVNLTALTNGSNADALHSHTNTNAALLDGLDGAQFLRSDASDTYSSGVLTLAAGTTLRAEGDIEVRGPVIPRITFWNNEFPNPSIEWNTHGAGTEDDRFELDRRLNVAGLIHAGPGADIAGPRPYHFLGNYLNGLPGSADIADGDDLFVTHDVEVGQTLYIKGLDMRFNVAGPDATQSLYFFDAGSATGESLRWNDTRGGFELTDDTGILGRLSVGSLPDDTVGYNRFGSGADVPDSGDVTATTDLYVQDDLEVDESLYVEEGIHLNEDGPDGNQVIYFYDGGLPGNQIISWDDANDRFQMSDNLRLWGSLDVNAVNAGPVLYNRFGTQNPPVSGDMTNINDVKIDEDLEVTSTAYIVGALVAGDGNPTTAQAFHSFGDGAGKDSPLVTSLADVYINGNLEVDGVIDTLNVHGSPATVLNLEADNNVRVMIDDDNSGTVNLAEWFHDASIASSSKLAELQEDGDFRIRGTLSQNVAFDVAESFYAGATLAPGELVAADPARPGAVRRTSIEDDPLVLGVVSARPGLLLGSAPFDDQSLATTWGEDVRAVFATQREALRAEVHARFPELATEESETSRADALTLELFFERNFAPVALAGRVRVRADASLGAIAPGDPLGPGPVPGVAMKVRDGGPVVAIALGSLSDGKGEVLAFVHRTRIEPASPTMRAPVSARAGAPETAAAGVPTAGTVAQAGACPDSNVDRRAVERSAVLTAVFPIAAPVEPGDVVAIDGDAVRPADAAMDSRVIGIVVADEAPAGQAAVALAGVVRCKVDATENPILPGDLLSASVDTGHAMRTAVPIPGTVVAKALEPLASGRGMIRVLVVAR